MVEVLDPAEPAVRPRAPARDSGRDLTILGLLASQLGSIIRLSALYDAVGTGLLRSLADPEGTGAFDEALAAVSDPEAGRGPAGGGRGLPRPRLGRAGARPGWPSGCSREVATYAQQTARQAGRQGGRPGRPTPPRR